MLNFGEDKSLNKIAGLIGRVIKVDQDTLHRDKLMFAKVLVEVCIDQNFPTEIQFMDEKWVVIHQAVENDWLPITCWLCKGIGHKQEACTRRNNQGKKRWLPKVVQPVRVTTMAQDVVVTKPIVPNSAISSPEHDGFVLATGFSRQKSTQLKYVSIGNKFHALEVDGNTDAHIEVLHNTVGLEIESGQEVITLGPDG